MSNRESGIVRLIDRVFPRMPNFYHLIDEQCDQCVAGMEVFVAYMESGDEELANEVRLMEKQGDELKARNISILDSAFATPIDREDIYRAIVSIDHILNYAKTTVREIEVLQCSPDSYMLEMALLLQQGAVALQQGYARLSTNPSEGEPFATQARKSERQTEKVYRRALAHLFDVEEITRELDENAPGATRKAMLTVIDIFKCRELYRHMSNGADRLAHAGDNLHNIIVKIA